MKKEKRRLVLSGTDDAYAKREAAKGANPDNRLPKEVPIWSRPAPGAIAPEKSASKRDGAKFGPTEQTEKHATKPTARPGPLQKTEHSIQVNYRLNLGLDLSARLQHLADAHDQPIDLVMKGLRSKAADRFKVLVSRGVKPIIPEPVSGGLSIRYAATFSGDLARNLNDWFDPFGLGVAKDACKPILVGLFQEEAKTLCEAAEQVGPAAA